MDIRLKVNIVNDRGEPFMGPGPLQLLEEIRRHKSANSAAREMRLSYVKALKMLNRLERNVGRQLFIRKRGGNQRGGTELTSYAERYVEEYGRLQERLRRNAEREFEAFARRLAKGVSGANG